MFDNKCAGNDIDSIQTTTRTAQMPNRKFNDSMNDIPYMSTEALLRRLLPLTANELT